MLRSPEILAYNVKCKQLQVSNVTGIPLLHSSSFCKNMIGPIFSLCVNTASRTSMSNMLPSSSRTIRKLPFSSANRWLAMFKQSKPFIQYVTAKILWCKLKTKLTHKLVETMQTSNVLLIQLQFFDIDISVFCLNAYNRS
jgi:hypothetical protein